jgi:hypothetical protein
MTDFALSAWELAGDEVQDRIIAESVKADLAQLDAKHKAKKRSRS